MNASPIKLNALQIGRGIAAVLVVLFHFHGTTTEYFHVSFFNNFFDFGIIGVDFFFVLSGFIITYVHLKDIVKDRKWGKFLLKRFIRIYPIYWIICSITLITYLLFTHGYIRSLDMQLNASRIPYLIKSYFLIPDDIPFFIRVAWTLTYEIIFYFVFALFILVGFKKSCYLYFTWILCIVINQAVFKQPIMLLNPRIVEFLIGCMAGYLIATQKPFYYLLGFAIFMPIDSIYITVTIMGVIVYFLAKANLSSKNLKVPLLIGDASYSIYLTHIFFMSIFFRGLVKFGNLYTAIIIFLGVIFCGVLVHLFVEKPTLNFLNNRLLKKGNLKTTQAVKIVS